MAERKGAIRIKGEGFNLTISSADKPKGLRRMGKDPAEIAVPQKKTVISPEQMAILKVLVLETFPEETQGVGEAEYSYALEKRTHNRYGKGKIEAEDYFQTIADIKKKSVRVEPHDIALNVLKTDGRFRRLQAHDATLQYAVNTLSEKISEYWEKPIDQKSNRVTIKRRPRKN